MADAYECVLYYCVKTYDSSVTNGVFKENVTQSWPAVNETLTNEPSSFSVIGPLNASTLDHQKYGNFTLKPPGQDLIYSVDALTFYLSRQWIQTIPDEFGFISGGVSYALGQFENSEIFYFAQKQDLDDSKLKSGPGAVMERIAESMTATMRQAGGSDLAAKGRAFVVRTHIRARWWWSVLPLALIVSTFLFLLSTILLSISKGIPVWKSSTLATLALGLDESTRQTIASKHLDDIEETTKEVKMTIHTDGRRWRLEGI